MMTAIRESLYIAWVIGAKDIQDALKNKATRINLLVLLFMAAFFYYLNVLRPFDRGVSVVVYDEGSTNISLEKVSLEDGLEYGFRSSASLEEMQQKMVYQDLGLVLPADLDQRLESGNPPVLRGYIFWADRHKVAQFEAMYTRALSEIIGKPVQVVIGENVLIPQAGNPGMQSNVTQHLVLFVFFTALTLIPALMMEEKHTRTMDALLSSPASPGQVVLGKAFAGLFYILLIGGLVVGMYWTYVVNWGLALLAFLGYACFAVGLGLALGSFLKSPAQLGLWMVVLILLLVIPATFYMEPNLKEGIRAVLIYFPSSALASLYRFACSTGVTPQLLGSNLAVVIISISLVFGLVVWKVRRSDR